LVGDDDIDLDFGDVDVSDAVAGDVDEEDPEDVLDNIDTPDTSDIDTPATSETDGTVNDDDDDGETRPAPSDTDTGDRQEDTQSLVALVEDYYDATVTSVARVERSDCGGYDMVTAFNDNGVRVADVLVIGEDVDAVGTVLPTVTNKDGAQTAVVVEDGCKADLSWVSDDVVVFDRSTLAELTDGTGESVNDDSDDTDTSDGKNDDDDEIGTKPIKELGDYYDSSAELWDDAVHFYSEGNKEQAREYVAGALMDEMDWMCIRDSSESGDYDLRVYDPEKGCFVENGNGVLEERMTKVLGGLATNGSEISKVEQLLANHCKVDLDETDAGTYDETLIPFQNGVLVLDSVEYDADTGTIDPSTAELRDPDPEFKFTHALPVDWNPDGCDMTLVEEWMDDMTAGDNVKARTLWEAGGHALLPRYNPQGFIIVIAEGSNGKTTLFNVFLEALGEENTTAIPLDKITDSQFSAYRMVDRLMNMHADISGATLDDVSALKAATGDDRMEVERKGIDPWDERNRATQLMAANSPPTIVEQNKAVKRRLMPVILDVEFVTDPDPENPFQIEKDPGMEDRLTEESALEAIVFKFVEAARRLQEQTEFTMAQEFDEDERMRLYESYADPIADFERACLERDPDGPGIAVPDIKACYDAFSVDKDHPEKKRSTLIDMLKKRATTVMRRSDPRSWTDDDSRIGVYKGMKFTEKAKKNWLPEDAHWDKYGRPDTDDASTEETGTAEDDLRVTVEEAREKDPTRLEDKHLRVKVAYDLDPRPWLHDEAVVTDETDTMRVQSIGEHELEEGEWYVIEDATIIPEDGDNHLQLVPAQTSVTKIDTAGNQEALPDDDDDDGDGETVNDGSDDAEDSDETASESDAAQESQTPARADGGDTGSDTEAVDQAVLQHADDADTAAQLAGVVARTVDADLETVQHRITKLQERGDIIIGDGIDVDDELVDAVEYYLDRRAGDGPVGLGVSVQSTARYLNKDVEGVDVDEETVRDGIAQLKAEDRLVPYRPGDESCELWDVTGDAEKPGLVR